MLATGRDICRDKTLTSTAWFGSMLGLQELSWLKRGRLCVLTTETERSVTSKYLRLT